jgi:hypothetical protein
MICRNSTISAWLAFLAIGTLWAVVTPLGEGFDEPWHVAYVQHIAQMGKVPLGHSVYVSQEIDLFLHTHPVSWGLHNNFPTLQSYEEYWQQPAESRKERDQLLAGMRFSGQYVEAGDVISGQYENHQPPLYYLISSGPFVVASRLFSFVNTYLLLRLFSVALASLVIPAVISLSEMIFKESRFSLSVVSLVVLFPGLYPDVARVSNDALVVPLVGWTLFFFIATLRQQQSMYVWGLCLMVVAGLWTKAFFIPILAGMFLVLLCLGRVRMAALLLAISALGSPWYLYNFMHTGSITGLPETVASKSSLLSTIHSLWELDWINLFNVTTSSHIWIGNWSFLGVRSWMYKVISWFFWMGALGVVAKQQARRDLFPLFVAYFVFVAGLVYYATQVFQQTRLSVAEGWYLGCFVPVEAILFTSGIRVWLGHRWNWGVRAMQLFLLVLLVYGAVFVCMPYYAGLTAHKADGHLAAYHPTFSGLWLMPSRLLRFHPWLPDYFVWALLTVSVGFGFYSMFVPAKFFRSRGAGKES